MTKGALRNAIVSGGELQSLIEPLADLRIQVFREWPYLYAGDRAYEARYLSRFAVANDAVLVAAFDGDALVGASTGLPLDQELDEFRAPFSARGIDVSEVFYLGESVLLPAYRGRGVGHVFFDGREAHARKLGRFTRTSFCRVVRSPDDPRQPPDYRPLDPFWRKRGYAPVAGLETTFPWVEIGETVETPKRMEFWMRALDPR